LKAVSNARASSSDFAVVVIVMFIPRSVSILSYSISGKMICSFTPRLKLPRPSKERDEMPRKSRMRGIAAPAQRHHASDRIALADLEGGDGGARQRHHRLLPGNLGEVADRVVHDLLVADRLAHAHVHHDLGDARNLHAGGVPELLDLSPPPSCSALGDVP
jgi:hypothetical protein